MDKRCRRQSVAAATELRWQRRVSAGRPDREIGQQLAAQIPWGQNCVLLDPLKDTATRAFHIRKTVEHGWSRSVLIHQLDTNLHKRLGKAPSNFPITPPSPHSDLAREIRKDPYIFKTAPLGAQRTNSDFVFCPFMAWLLNFLVLTFSFRRHLPSHFSPLTSHLCVARSSQALPAP